ncbi:Epoxide hydrolase [Pseudonocardia sp. Ae406_Ps2]|uniref:alpha/beta fold hydrolase n=1 Tax=unclassified Pseudonocardia TaxID=2619320 RepID=UPI00094B54FF|nr:MULTISPECIES: alpha/beta fold hydrolase [unclassified Pseudonocardia]OLL99892.1 Epoxide hydrolase [Pseudonocardia sp. Ae331_Ps2]OLM02362.1 Epoxide hydrolase [Pseudonocardia sp. Ae406_Ps2]OLM23934.1 Epoxide hydrolase [Pseudonocardia sp. Ae706_Ps2]
MTLPEPRRITVPGTTLPEITLSVHDTGGVGSPVLLLHGWPDRAALWAHQAAALAGAGYRVVVPDLRGFGDSDRPAEVEHYPMRALVADVLGVADALGIDRFALAGHDWGASLGWAVPLASPRVTRYAAFSVGHPAAFATAGFRQKAMSWYMLWFQFPGVAEQVMPAEDWQFLRGWLHATLPDGHPMAARHVADLSRPGALTASLNWYRANVDPARFVPTTMPEPPRITVPTMGVWSDGDLALTEGQMRGSSAYVDDFRFERVEGCGHWIPEEAPEAASALLLDFLAGGREG